MAHRLEPRQVLHPQGHPTAPAALRHHRPYTQDLQAVAEVQADRHQETIPEEAAAEVLQAVTDHPDRTGHPQAGATHPVLHQGVPTVTRQAEAPQAHILRAAQAVAAAFQEAGSPAVDHPEAPVDPTVEVPEAVAEEDNH